MIVVDMESSVPSRGAFRILAFLDYSYISTREHTIKYLLYNLGTL